MRDRVPVRGDPHGAGDDLELVRAVARRFSRSAWHSCGTTQGGAPEVARMRAAGDALGGRMRGVGD